MSNRQATHCPMCNQLLESYADRAMGVCSDPKCQGPFFHKKRMNALAQRRSWRENYARELLTQWPEVVVSGSSGVDLMAAEPMPVVITVPALNRPTIPLPEHRKKLFRDHLEVTLTGAIEMLTTGDRLDNLRTEFSHRDRAILSPAPATVINGCSTCRGFCCRQGGNTAFLSPGFFAWQLLDREASSEALRQKYVEQLPDESIEDSCVFHTQRGCVLSRDDRNEICNNFHCEGLMDAFDRIEQEPAVTSIAISTDGDKAFRVGVMDTNGIRQEREF